MAYVLMLSLLVPSPREKGGGHNAMMTHLFFVFCSLF